MDGGALDHALEARGRLRIARAFRDQPGQVLVEEFRQVALEAVEVDAAGAQHRGGILVIAQGQQQVFECRVFVAPFAGQCQGPVERLLEVAGQHVSDAPLSVARQPHWVGAAPGIQS